MDWTMVGGIATVVYTIVVLIGATIAVLELDHMARDRYVSITNALLEIWVSPEFQRAQFWILYELDETNWEQFIAKHGAGYGEQALVTVGSFYNQIGTLTQEGLLPLPHLLLRSIGGYTIAVWDKIAPLVEQARQHEISSLFWNFEWLVAESYRVYKPDHPRTRDKAYLAGLERLAGRVTLGGRPGLRIFSRWPKSHPTEDDHPSD